MESCSMKWPRVFFFEFERGWRKKLPRFFFSLGMGKEERRGGKNPRHSFVHERNLGQVETFAFIPNNRGM